MHFAAYSDSVLEGVDGIQTLPLKAGASQCPAQGTMVSTKGLRVRNSPICTLSQNGYGACSATAAPTVRGLPKGLETPSPDLEPPSAEVADQSAT